MVPFYFGYLFEKWLNHCIYNMNTQFSVKNDNNQLSNCFYLF